jgi:hypothetical protein
MSGEEHLKTLTVQEAIYDSAAQRAPISLQSRLSPGTMTTTT